MSWATFYLVCFGVGFTLSVLSFVLGALNLHVPLKWHLPIGAGHHVVGVPHAAHGPALHSSHSAASLSWLNLPTFLVFLAWFGGTGYLLTQYSSFWFLLSLTLATGSGLVGAAIVSLFLLKILLPHESSLRAADFQLVGLLAAVNVPIRAGGTGEVIFSQGGTRRSAGARSDDGTSIAKGTEVVITRYHKGIAYVRRWEDWAT